MVFRSPPRWLLGLSLLLSVGAAVPLLSGQISVMPAGRWGLAGMLAAAASWMLLAAHLLVEQVLLRRQSAEFRQVLDHLADWALVLDRDGRVQYASEAIRRYSLSASDINGRPWRDALPIANLSDLSDLLNHVRPGTGSVCGAAVCQLVLPSGDRRIMEVTGVRTMHRGGFRFVLFFRDATEQQRLRQSLTEMDRLASVVQLARGVAHNFNNVLAGIILNTELLIQADAEEREILAHRVLASAERGAVLCHNLLTFARGAPALPTHVNVSALVPNVVGLFEAEAHRHGVEVSCTAEQGLSVYADEGQIQQILLNLLLNAREAAGNGGWIQVSACNCHDSVHVIVANSGEPIAANHLPMIFLPFFSTKTDSYQGTGMGLPVSQRLAEGMGGCIGVSSAAGEPTTFTLVLPMGQAGEKTALSREV